MKAAIFYGPRGITCVQAIMQPFVQELEKAKQIILLSTHKDRAKRMEQKEHLYLSRI